jgi:transglutaminase-like putative cysteine protease
MRMNAGSKRLEVKHETSYHYQSSVALGYSLAWLTPRNTAAQQLLEHRLQVFPKPRFQCESSDAFGNIQHYFEVHKAHSELRVQSHAIVESAIAPDLNELIEPWENARPKGIGAGVGDPPPWEFIYATELVPLHAHYTDYARAIFTPERPLGEALLAFTRQIFTDFQYLPGSTQVDTPLAAVWENRAGVCQDFAHLALAALRGIGLAAAYVSGYLLTYARDGEEKHIGADASHAWFAVWANGRGWIHLDPTNNKVVGNEHIVLALGRDYADTPPVKGVCFGGGLHHLRVAVTVNDLSATSNENPNA